jgi:aspartyl aminopeptidase
VFACTRDLASSLTAAIAFHAVKSAKDRLEKAGFKQIKVSPTFIQMRCYFEAPPVTFTCMGCFIAVAFFCSMLNLAVSSLSSSADHYQERDSWAPTIQPGGKYYLTRNGSSIVAFAVGKKWKAGNPIGMIGAHTDSPCLRIKPVSKRQSDGFIQVACETYGGGLWHTWFDRDLSIAGRVMVRTKEGKIEQRLVKVERPILRIPTLAIHLDRQENFQFNKETQLFPIAGLVQAELNRQGKTEESKDDEKKDTPFEPLDTPYQRHHPFIVEIIAEEAGASPEDVLDFEIVLYDTQKSAIGGLNNELIFSPRLDNLMMSYCSVEGLIKSLSSSSSLDKDSTIRLIALFDHEEIGSQTAQGADSNLLPAVIRRLSVLPASESSNSDTSYDKIEADTATAYEQTLPPPS